MIDESFVKSLSLLGSRGVFGLAMKDFASAFPDLRVVVADVKTSAKLESFAQENPGKLVNVGIAEQNMVSVAAGMASEGYNVFATTFAPFASLRCYEMQRTLVGYMKLNVKTVGLLSGLTGSAFGSTHFGIDDLAVMRMIPNMTVISPADGLAVYKCMEALMSYQGPAYVRLTGDRGMSVIYKEDFDYQIGKANYIKRGEGVAIVGCGSILGEAIRAARGLKRYGIDPTIVDMHTVKPLDETVLDEVFANHRLVVTLEEHQRFSGLGGAVAEYKAAKRAAPPQLILAIDDQFPHGGSVASIQNSCNLSAPRVVERIVLAWNNLACGIQ